MRMREPLCCYPLLPQRCEQVSVLASGYHGYKLMLFVAEAYYAHKLIVPHQKHYPFRSGKFLELIEPLEPVAESGQVKFYDNPDKHHFYHIRTIY